MKNMVIVMKIKSRSHSLIRLSRSLFFFVSAFILTDSTHAFNWEECNKTLSRPGNWVGVYGLTSMTQWSSSWGECSMIGEVSHDRKIFLAQNIDKLQVDIARGDGEYLQALAELYECPAKNYSDFARTLKDNYSNIFHLSQRNISKVDGFILNSFEIKNACSDLKKHES